MVSVPRLLPRFAMNCQMSREAKEGPHCAQHHDNEGPLYAQHYDTKGHLLSSTTTRRDTLCLAPRHEEQHVTYHQDTKEHHVPSTPTQRVNLVPNTTTLRRLGGKRTELQLSQALISPKLYMHMDYYHPSSEKAQLTLSTGDVTKNCLTSGNGQLPYLFKNRK